MNYHSSPYDPPVFALPRGYDDSKRPMASARAALEQVPPPTLREILGAYRTKGDGDRDTLLALLNAKAAEDQRIASIASLHRTMLEIYERSSTEQSHHDSRSMTSAPCNFPAPAYPQYPPSESHRSSCVHCRPLPSSRSRSPPPPRSVARHNPYYHPSEPPYKRRSSRSAHSAHMNSYESHMSEQYPLSPYSSSNQSDSAENSPRSKSSMTIGSLLSTRPACEITGDPSRERV